MLDNYEDICEEDEKEQLQGAMSLDSLRDIHVSQQLLSLAVLVDRISSNRLRFSTDFQRNGELWSPVQKSRFIESILMGFPIPAFYFSVSEDNAVEWDIVDGLQRSTALRSFFLEGMKLSGLEFLSNHFDNFSFRLLPPGFQRKMLQTNVVVYLVEKGTPAFVKFSIFHRLNTGGLFLNAQEIRQAVNNGRPAQVIKHIAESDKFKIATKHQVSSKRMRDLDFVTHFVSFYLQPYESYTGNQDAFLTQGMALIRKLSVAEIESMIENFNDALETINKVLGPDAFQRPTPKGYYRLLNKSLFEILTVSIAKLPPNERLVLENRANSFKQAFDCLFNDEDFVNSIASSVDSVRKVKTRHQAIESIINKTLKNI